MSAKVLLGVALVAIAIAAPFAIPALGIAAAGSFAAIALTAAVEVGVSLASSALLGPGQVKVPSSLANGARDRLYATLDPTALRKWALGGTTALATDVRYDTYTGTDQDTYWQVVCCASHEVHSIDELWLDNEQAWTSGGGAQGRYVGYLTVTAQTLGTNANGVAIDASWTSSCTLTGCAYLVLQYKLSDNSDTDKSPFASGVSTRMTIRGKGAKVYDPRLDGTVPGGSGTQRAATQSTWAWDDNASRNPALQLLFYLLGWDINSKLALGMGLPPARIDLVSFITAANACDESIALNGGGTEPRYRCDGVLSEGDDRSSVIESLCTQMNGTLRDAGGKISLTVLHNDLSSPVASFTEGDILGGEQWSQTPPVNQCFNIVRGRRIDPSDTALYQPADYPEAKLTSNDGIDRIDTADWLLTQSNGQAQRLAKQRLERKQYQGRYEFTGGPRWWQASIGDVVQQSHQGLGWANKLFRMVGQTISRTGETKVVLIEENAAIYAWDNSEAAPVTPAAPTIYDPHNSPILQGITKGLTNNGTNELKDVQFGNAWTLTAGAVRARANSTLGYARGRQPYYCQLSPSTSLIRSATSELVPVLPGQRVYFKIGCQRGTTLGSGSRLNMGHEWVKADGTTTTGTPAEGTQQTPGALTAGAAPVAVFWSDVAPALAAFVRIKPYTPALASSSGTFRVEAPVISKLDLGGVPLITFGPSSYTVQYNADGTAQSGQLPHDLYYKFATGGVEQTSGVAMTYTVLSGGVNGFTSGSHAMSVGATTGIGILTISSLEKDVSTVQIVGTWNGSVAKATVTLAKAYATAGAGGGGGTGSTTLATKNGFSSINSSTFTDISGTMTGVMPAGTTTAYLNAQISFDPGSSSPAGGWTIQLKWQRNISGTWTDQGTFAADSSSVELIDVGSYSSTPAMINNSQTVTGLTAGTSYDWRLVARISAGSARTHFASGTATVSV